MLLVLGVLCFILAIIIGAVIFMANMMADTQGGNWFGLWYVGGLVALGVFILLCRHYNWY